MTTREEFLGTIRVRLKDGIPANPVRPVVPDWRVEPIGYTADLSDPVASFRGAAIAAGAEVLEPGGRSNAEVLAGILEDVHPPTAIVSRDPECAGVAAILESSGVRVLKTADRDLAASAVLGVTGALAGIALTGSVVVDSRRAGTRLASLLPEVHLVLLDPDRIVPTPGDIVRHIRRWMPQGLPSNMVFITGPSRSADIELQLTVGVHGPKRVLIALI
ncbi:MAG: LutC/YkgG family protein [Candidatus Limnocylindria bacterium]